MQYSSGSVAKRKPGLIHSTISSAIRDRCTISTAAAMQVSSAKSRSLTASSELRHGAAKPSSSAVYSRSSE